MERIIVLTKARTSNVSMVLKLEMLVTMVVVFLLVLVTSRFLDVVLSCYSDKAQTYQLNWHGPRVLPSVRVFYNEENLARTYVLPVYFGYLQKHWANTVLCYYVFNITKHNKMFYEHVLRCHILSANHLKIPDCVNSCFEWFQPPSIIIAMW